MSIIYINPFQFAAAPVTGLLLDDYPGAACAYSLRQLRAGVASVVRVRRSSDNAELDFTADEVSNGTLTAWVGAGNDGFVSIWYDQSGNGHNASQETLGNQPLVVSSGSLVVENAKPSLDFNGTSHRLTSATLLVNQPNMVFAVCKRDDIGSPADVVLDGINIQHVLYNNGTTEYPNYAWSIAAGEPLAASAYNPATLLLVSAVFNYGSSLIFADGSQLAAGYSGNGSLTGLSIGDIRGTPGPIIPGYAFDGKISEIIIYSFSDLTSRASIDANINAHYAIY